MSQVQLKLKNFNEVLMDEKIPSKRNSYTYLPIINVKDHWPRSTKSEDLKEIIMKPSERRCDNIKLYTEYAARRIIITHTVQHSIVIYITYSIFEVLIFFLLKLSIFSPCTLSGWLNEMN